MESKRQPVLQPVSRWDVYVRRTASFLAFSIATFEASDALVAMDDAMDDAMFFILSISASPSSCATCVKGGKV